VGVLRRFCVAFVVLSTLLGAVRAFAASLDASTSTLGGGEAVVASCQSTPLTATYTTSYDPAIAGYGVSGVVGPGASQLAESTGTTPASGTSFTASSPATSHVRASDVTSVSVTITG
jgi:hypothetical protein